MMCSSITRLKEISLEELGISLQQESRVARFGLA